MRRRVAVPRGKGDCAEAVPAPFTNIFQEVEG